MATLVQAVWIVVLALASMATLVVCVMVLRLMRLRWQAMHARTVAREDMPEDIRRLLDIGGQPLFAQGFAYGYSAASTRALVTPQDTPQFFDVYPHADGHTHAVVSPSPVPEPNQPCMVQWVTCLNNGNNWITLNRGRHLSPMDVPRWRVFDDYLPAADMAWQRHLERVHRAQGRICTDGIEVRRRLLRAFDKLIPSLVQQGRLILVDGGPHYRLCLPAALRMALDVLFGQWRSAWSRRGAPPSQPATLGPGAIAGMAHDHGVDADVRAFAEQRALLRGAPASARRKWLVFLVTGLLFLLVGGWWMSWSLVAIVLAVVALHEGGHYLAMKLTGYSNLSVFFLPGLGGLAMGEKPHATPFEKVLVYLAGPVPGIALAGTAFWASAAGYWSAPAWLNEFLLVSLAINYLNLLPLVPLDGGRVMETLVFAHHPRLRFVFAALCCGLLFGLGMALDDMVLRVVAVAIALSLPSQWRRMQLDQAIARDSQSTLDEHQALTHIFTALQQVRFRTWSFAQRSAAATALLPELMGRRAHAGEAIFGMLVYGACLLGPVGMALVAVPNLAPALTPMAQAARIPADDVDPTSAQPTAVATVDWSERLTRVSTLPADAQLETYLGAARQARDAEDSDMALRHYQNAWTLAQALPARDLRRMDALEGLADQTEDEAQRRTYLHQIITELEQPVGLERLRVADAKEQLSYSDVPLAERVALLRQALQLRRVGLGTDDAIATTRLMLARALDDSGDSAEAEAQLLARTADLPLPAASDRSRLALQQRVRHVIAQVDLAWFLMAHGRSADALHTASNALRVVPAKVTVSWLNPHQQTLEAILWAHLLSPNPKEGLAGNWEAYEVARRNGFAGSRKVLVHEVDRALVAKALQDTRKLEQAYAGIGEALVQIQQRPLSLCQPTNGLASNWRSPQQAARQRVLTERGICAPAAPQAKPD